MKRRTAFQLGLTGGALLWAGGLTWVGLRATKLGPEPRRPLQALSRSEFAVIVALADCMLGPQALPDRKWPTPWQLQCPEKVDAVVAQLHPEACAEFKQLIGLFENGLSGLLTTLRPTPFSQLTVAAQQHRLNSWRTAPFSLMRSGYLALTRLIHATYYSSPEVYAALGYPGPPDVPFVPNALEGTP
ncbi:MAG: hypothetical protein SF187_16680 [Deltaproteobacteria bacterium]|nr:hypothetical protein [Deltaproteobacteria bacterium]